MSPFDVRSDTPLLIAYAQTRFLGILPRIRVHARIHFRNVRCHCRKADLIAEAIALAWKWFLRLAQKGKDACQFPAALATFAAKAVRSGRRLCGQLKAKDVLSERAQQRRGFFVSKLPDVSTLEPNPLSEALIDNTRSPVPDQVHFRLDFPVWLRTQSTRNRRLIKDMMTGERTLDLARRYGLSSARVSQLRREFHDDWRRFCDEPPLRN